MKGWSAAGRALSVPDKIGVRRLKSAAPPDSVERHCALEALQKAPRSLGHVDTGNVANLACLHALALK